MPLTPGDYHLHLVARNRENTIVDHVERAGEFSVVPADVLGTGYMFSAGEGQFTVPWEWELRPSNGEV